MAPIVSSSSMGWRLEVSHVLYSSRLIRKGDGSTAANSGYCANHFGSKGSWWVAGEIGAAKASGGGGCCS